MSMQRLSIISLTVLGFITLAHGMDRTMHQAQSDYPVIDLMRLDEELVEKMAGANKENTVPRERCKPNKIDLTYLGNLLLWSNGPLHVIQKNGVGKDMCTKEAVRQVVAVYERNAFSFQGRSDSLINFQADLLTAQIKNGLITKESVLGKQDN